MSDSGLSEYRQRVRDRVRNARELGLGPMQSGRYVEGEHYDVLAYTDWADLFVPTVVRWAGTDEPDDLSDLDRSTELAEMADREVRG